MAIISGLKIVLDSLKVLLSQKADKKDLVKANWNQNDETALDYIKGRTHYTEKEGAVLFDGDITLILEGSDYTGTYAFPTTLDFVEGQEYQLTYEGTIATFTMPSTLFAVFGGNGMNFTVDPGKITIQYPDPVGGHLTIETTSVIHKLDEKYIPDAIARVVDVPHYEIEEDFVFADYNSAPISGQAALVIATYDREYSFVVGETYTLTIDGVTTTTECTDKNNITIAGTRFGLKSNTDGTSSLNAFTNWTQYSKVKFVGSRLFIHKLDTELYKAVTSLNGETGDITITPDSIGAAKVSNTMLSGSIMDYSPSVIAHYLDDGHYLYKNGNQVVVDTPLNVQRTAYFSQSGVESFGDDSCVANLSYVKKKVSECVPAPSTAEVGQVLSVKAVDENGKPSEWEVISLDSSQNGDFLCLQVYSQELEDGSYTYRWEQDYIYDQIYNAAINGKLSCIYFYMDSSEEPDVAQLCRLKYIYLKHHPDGSRVTFEYPNASDFIFEWTADGFDARDD